MAYFDEQSHGEIAQKLRLPLGTVKSRLRLALEKLRTRLKSGN
jgi:RNA polymerase sigma-70 factor (ECF subfamily)